VYKDGAHSIRSQLQKVTLHVFCTSVLEFYELLNETIFKSLGETLCTVLCMNFKEGANIPFLIWVQKTVLPSSGKI
jgi:hypothetical protein